MELNKKYREKLDYISDEMVDYYIYIKSIASFYWIDRAKLFKPKDVASNLMCNENDLKALRRYWYIETYNDLCYSSKWIDWCYNLLDINKIIQPSNNPLIDTNIEILINNICWYKKENIKYLHKAILYKYHNIDDFTIPAIILYWTWWSWKWTFISLLSTIFQEENVLANLWQRDISWWFDTYKWQKLIVSFDEISSNSTRDDIRILNRLKNIIWAEKITINEKWEKQYQINNIAWFFISSNSNKPIQLDDKDKWNRRFTIIKSDTSLKNWENINKSVRDKKKVSNYLAWLYLNYPEVLKYKKLDALENNDKAELEDRSQNEANNFWERFFENYPNSENKIIKTTIISLMDDYCIKNWIDDINSFKKYFWNYSKYPLKKIRILDKTMMWVNIERTQEQIEQKI